MGAPPRVVAIVGPTGVGKSDVGVAVAEALGGEVVNADSMQLYRGMDIGTAKLGEAERRGVPHHLLDIWAVTERASVADYQRRARAVIDELRARGRTPVLVGGSGLYLRAVLDRFEFPGTDPELRAALEARLAAEGPAALHRELAGADPQAAAGILPSNGRRIVRALEVIELTGAPFTATLPDESRPHYRAAAQVGLDTDATALDERLARRTDVMFERGLVDEVRRLEADGLRRGVTARRALGYAQVLRLLDGELTEPAARDETVTATRRFARRQRSWFRRDGRIRWVEAGQPLERLVGAVVAAVTRSA